MKRDNAREIREEDRERKKMGRKKRQRPEMKRKAVERR